MAKKAAAKKATKKKEPTLVYEIVISVTAIGKEMQESIRTEGLSSPQEIIGALDMAKHNVLNDTTKQK